MLLCSHFLAKVCLERVGALQHFCDRLESCPGGSLGLRRTPCLLLDLLLITYGQFHYLDNVFPHVCHLFSDGRVFPVLRVKFLL